MKVSVVIRSKNEEKTIGLLFEKLSKQTFKDFEVILVDNSSTDKTVEIARKYKIDKIINIPEGKFSHPYSTNIGVKNSEGDLVVITNAHCIPFSDKWIEKGIKNFNDKNVAAIDGFYTYQEKREFLQRFGKKNKPISTTNAIIRKSLWEEYPFDESLSECEDYDWSLEMLSRGYKLIKDPDFSVRHIHKVTDETKQKWEEIKKIIDKRKRPTKL